MRALVVSAFALTLFLSAVTVYFALNSDVLDGEPYASIAIDPPTKTLKASAPLAPKPSIATTASQASVTETEPNAESANVGTSASTAKSVANAAPNNADTPKLTPVSETNEANRDIAETTSAQTDSATSATELTNRRTTEVARPVSTTPAVTDDPFFSSAEPGIGLGVGNLGPLEPISTN